MSSSIREWLNPQRAVFSRFRWNHVGRQNVYFTWPPASFGKLDNQAVRERDGFGGVAWCQRRSMLHRL